MALANKLQEYAEQVTVWKDTFPTWPIKSSIELLARNHFPRNMRKYATNEIWLRVTEMEYQFKEGMK